MKNWSYTITEGEYAGKTLWSGRYCAIAAFVFCKFPDGWRILANKRGKGTPDFQGKWNCPCGYLEADESAQEGCAREVYEETGVKVSSDSFRLIYVETDPQKCNNGNVTLRYIAILKHGRDNVSVSMSAVLDGAGEKEEVESIAWIPLDNLESYEWAFNHLEVIKNLTKSYIMFSSEFSNNE